MGKSYVSVKFTSADCIYARKRFENVPVLVTTDGTFVEPVNHYLRTIVMVEKCKVSSAKTFAQQLQHLCNSIARDLDGGDHSFGNLSSVSEVLLNFCDLFLSEWLNMQEEDGVSSGTRAGRCDTVFGFFCWLQSRGDAQGFVKFPHQSEPEFPRLTSRPPRMRPGRPQSSRYGIVSALRPNAEEEGLLPIPTREEVGRLYAHISATSPADLVARNTLLLDWYYQAGLRRFEWANLLVEQIPEIESLDSSEPREIKLTTTKGGRVQSLQIEWELLLKTREYIEGERAELVSVLQSRSSYIEPPQVFLSKKTGKPMNPGSISNFLKKVFAAARVPGTGHRLRASHLDGLVRAEYDAEEAAVRGSNGAKVMVDEVGVLNRVAERARQRNPDSLKPYVSRRAKQHAKQSSREKQVTAEMAIKAKENQLDALNAQISALQRQLTSMQAEAKATASPKAVRRRPTRR